MQRVLFITSTRIGDAIINSGVLNYLIETRPEAHFTIACGPLAAPLFTAVPRLERLIVMAKKKGGGHWFDLWRDTVGKRWDLVVDMRRSATSWILRARERRILAQSDLPIDKVVEAAGVLRLEEPPAPKIHLSDTARARAAELVPAGDTFLALCPSASLIYKTWPGERFAELARRVTAEDGFMPGARIAVFGGPGDHDAAAPLHDLIPPDQLIDLTGQLDLMEVAACMDGMRLFIGNDSGLMHMSAAMKVPTLGLFGPSDDRRYGPFGGHCAIVRGTKSFEEIDRAFRDRRQAPDSLLLDLDVDAAYDAAHKLFERTRS